jgi:hypothetical protein
VVVILIIIGIGWNTFFAGVFIGFERVIDVGTPIVKDLTQEARDIVNNPNFVITN